MKKLSFSLIVILLVSIIITLTGYHSLVIHRDSQKYQELNKEYQNTTESTNQTSTSHKPTIYCIGDSLTIGNKSSSYPTALSSLTGFSVNKFGGSQDQSIDISIRMGKTKIYVNQLTIPSTSTPVEIKILDNQGNQLDVLKGTGSNFSTVEISGITGRLKFDTKKKIHTFTRDEAGNEMKINKLTQIKSDFPKFDENSIFVIFTGTYDPLINNGIFKTITYQRSIISHLKTKRYIVVSLTSQRRLEIADDMNKVLLEENNEHFLDFRSYLLKNGLKDASITPTQQDKKDLQMGYIPSSLLKEDKLNGNSKFNELLAKQLVKKMKDLKYITENDLQR